MKNKIDSDPESTESRIFKAQRKKNLEIDGELNCSFCRPHRSENLTYKRRGKQKKTRRWSRG